MCWSGLVSALSIKIILRKGLTEVVGVGEGQRAHVHVGSCAVL